MNKKDLSTRYLAGRGVEFSAMHNPLCFDAEKTEVLYADHLGRAQATKRFPELDNNADINDPDILVDIDLDDLSFIKKEGLDFVIANHVIEYLVNPIRFLKKVSANLKDQDMFLLSVPNKDFTHDVNRRVTRYRHLLVENWLNLRRLSKAHIRDYLLNKLEVKEVHPKTAEYFGTNGLPLSYYKGNKLPLNPIKRRKLYAYRRERSIYVYVWDREAFEFFLNRTIEMFRLNFEMIHYLPHDASPGEMIFLLRKVSL